MLTMDTAVKGFSLEVQQGALVLHVTTEVGEETVIESTRLQPMDPAELLKTLTDAAREVQKLIGRQAA